eukprot:Em1247g1a
MEVFILKFKAIAQYQIPELFKHCQPSPSDPGVMRQLLPPAHPMEMCYQWQVRNLTELDTGNYICSFLSHIYHLNVTDDGGPASKTKIKIQDDVPCVQVCTSSTKRNIYPTFLLQGIVTKYRQQSVSSQGTSNTPEVHEILKLSSQIGDRGWIMMSLPDSQLMLLCNRVRNRSARTS